MSEEEDTQCLSDDQAMIINNAQAFAKQGLPAKLAGKALAALAENKADLYVIGVLNAWEDTSDRRNLLLAVREEINLAEMIVLAEFTQVKFEELKDTLPSELAAEVLCLIGEKIGVEKEEPAASQHENENNDLMTLHNLIKQSAEMEKTNTAARLFANLVSLAAEHQFPEATSCRADYLEVFLEKLGTNLNETIRNLKEAEE